MLPDEAFKNEYICDFANSRYLTIRKQVPISREEDIEVILSPDATIVKDDTLNRKVVVKKCSEDNENRELALTYALLKLHGITPAQVQRMLSNAKDYREPKKKKVLSIETSDK